MNEILQKRIEEAARDYSDHNYIDEGVEVPAFIEGADFALKNQWISVEEALPEEDEQVIAMSEFGNIERMKYHNKAFYHLKGSIIKDGEKITNWMPIPEMKGDEK